MVRSILVTLVLTFASLACSRSPHLAGGPIDLSPAPILVAFDDTVHSSGPLWEMCFEFDLPGDSHHANQIRVVLVGIRDERYTLAETKLDRRGESVVCQIGRISPIANQGSTSGYAIVMKGVELTSGIPLRVHGLRGGSRS